MTRHITNEVVAVGIIRQDGEGKLTHIDQSALNQLPTGTILFVQRTAPVGEALLQEVVAIQSLRALMFNPQAADVIETTKLASAVITASRRKLDLATGALEILRNGLAASEAVRKAVGVERDYLQSQVDKLTNEATAASERADLWRARYEYAVSLRGRQLAKAEGEAAADAAEVAFWRERYPHALMATFDNAVSSETVGERIAKIRGKAKAEV